MDQILKDSNDLDNIYENIYINSNLKLSQDNGLEKKQKQKEQQRSQSVQRSENQQIDNIFQNESLSLSAQNNQKLNINQDRGVQSQRNVQGFRKKIQSPIKSFRIRNCSKIKQFQNFEIKDEFPNIYGGQINEEKKQRISNSADLRYQQVQAKIILQPEQNIQNNKNQINEELFNKNQIIPIQNQQSENSQKNFIKLYSKAQIKQTQKKQKDEQSQYADQNIEEEKDESEIQNVKEESQKRFARKFVKKNNISSSSIINEKGNLTGSKRLENQNSNTQQKQTTSEINLGQINSQSNIFFPQFNLNINQTFLKQTLFQSHTNDQIISTINSINQYNQFIYSYKYPNQSDIFQKSSNQNDSITTGRSQLIDKKHFMPMEEMHYVAVKHFQYMKNIENQQQSEDSENSSQLSIIEPMLSERRQNSLNARKIWWDDGQENVVVNLGDQSTKRSIINKPLDKKK